MDLSKQIQHGEICPYCLKKPELVDSACVYGKSYGDIWLCKDCDAYVGVHKNSGKALGRLANSTLRYYKKQAHAVFDPIWKSEISPTMSKKVARSKAYIWLAKKMNLQVEDCHIGMFDENQCIEVIRTCSKYLPES